MLSCLQTTRMIMKYGLTQCSNKVEYYYITAHVLYNIDSWSLIDVRTGVLEVAWRQDNSYKRQSIVLLTKLPSSMAYFQVA